MSNWNLKLSSIEERIMMIIGFADHEHIRIKSLTIPAEDYDQLKVDMTHRFDGNIRSACGIVEVKKEEY